MVFIRSFRRGSVARISGRADWSYGRPAAGLGGWAGAPPEGGAPDILLPVLALEDRSDEAARDPALHRRLGGEVRLKRLREPLERDRLEPDPACARQPGQEQAVSTEDLVLDS